MVGNNVTTVYSKHKSRYDGGSVYTGFTLYVVYKCV